MRREEQAGIFGKHEDLERVVNEVKNYSKGVTRKELQESLDMKESQLRHILVQADALGMVMVQGAEPGREGRVFYTDNEQLHFDLEETSKDDIEDKISEKLENLSETDQLRVSIQSVEE